MTKAEALVAQQQNKIVQFKDEPDRWGIITCLSDDESCAYINPKGASLFRSCVKLDQIELG